MDSVRLKLNMDVFCVGEDEFDAALSVWFVPPDPV